MPKPGTQEEVKPTVVAPRAMTNSALILPVDHALNDDEYLLAPTFDETEYEHRISQAKALDKARYDKNLDTRFDENIKFAGATGRVIYDYEYKDDSEHLDYDLEVASLLGSSSGYLMAVILRRLYRGKYKRDKSLNPFYRIFKTLANVGLNAGILFSYLIPDVFGLQKFFCNILADLFSVIFGLCAFPYLWLFPQSEKDIKNAIVGFNDGWTKYGKAALTYGIFLGQFCGAIYAKCHHAVLNICVAIASAVIGLTSFIASLILVPLLNKLLFNVFINKDYRSNYLRSGIVLGGALGSILGFVVGTFLFPGLGSAFGLALGMAAGSALGGYLLGKHGDRLTAYIEKHWTKTKDTDNSWDYTTRNSAYIFAFLGTAIGFLLPIPGGTALGAAIGSAIGWCAGIYIIKKARQKSPIEVLATDLDKPILPWTQRAANAATKRAIIGGLIGFAIGFLAGGPPLAFTLAIVGFGIAGFVGGGLGAYKERKEIVKKENEIKQLIAATSVNNPKPLKLNHRNSYHHLHINIHSKNKRFYPDASTASTPTETPSPTPSILQNSDSDSSIDHSLSPLLGKPHSININKNRHTFFNATNSTTKMIVKQEKTVMQKLAFN
jgi:hypothetical protein